MLTTNGKTLIIIVFFRLLFGGYLIGTDQFRYDDTSSALTVFAIYALLGFFAALFLFGKRIGLTGILVLSTILIIFHTVFIFVALAQTDVGAHNPSENILSTVLRYPFYLLTLYFCVRIYRENKHKKVTS